MSGATEAALLDFFRLVRIRLGNAGVLAEFAGIGRAHLSNMLHGDQARGAFTWPKLRRHVTSAEWRHLERCSAWNTFKIRSGSAAAQVLEIKTCDDPTDSIMPVICTDCSKALKTKRCAPAQAGKRSDGLCPACFRRRLELMNIPAAEIERKLAEIAALEAAEEATGETTAVPQQEMLSL